MLHVEVIAVDGAAPAPPVAVVIGAEGGTIGRGPDNALSLPDPQRTISRTQAQIAVRQGIIKLIGRGTNPLMLEGAALVMGEEIPVEHPVVIEMGAYHLRLTPQNAAA